MPTYYIDPTLGSDLNAGTSEGAPWATIGKITSASAWVAGNTFLLRRGRTFTERLILGANGTATSPITISNYGPAGDGLPLMRPTLANSKGVDFGGYAGIVIDGLDCKSTDNDPGIWFSAYQSGANVLPVVIRNNRVTSSDTGTGSGIQGYVGRGFNSAVIDAWTESPGNVLIENNYVYRTGNLGIGFGDYKNVTVRGNKVVECCLREEQIGIIISQSFYSSLLSWTLVSGNVYKTTITAVMRDNLRGKTGTDSVRFKFPSTDIWSLRENNSVAAASIASGDYQESAGELYVNMGGLNPNTATENWFAFGGTRNWIIEDNVVLDTIALNGREGVGIQADAFVGYGIIRRNYVRTNNGQPGIAHNDARSVQIIGNVVENIASGAGGGLAFSDGYQGCGPVVCENNTAIVRGLVTDASAFNFGGTKSGGSFKFNNNIVVGTPNSALIFYSPDSTCAVEWKNNCYFGPANSRTIYNSTLTESGNLNTNPKLRADYMPMSSAVRSVGAPSGRGDFYGKEFRGTIGAVQYQTPSRALFNKSLPDRVIPLA